MQINGKKIRSHAATFTPFVNTRLAASRTIGIYQELLRTFLGVGVFRFSIQLCLAGSKPTSFMFKLSQTAAVPTCCSISCVGVEAVDWLFRFISSGESRICLDRAMNCIKSYNFDVSAETANSNLQQIIS